MAAGIRVETGSFGAANIPGIRKLKTEVYQREFPRQSASI
jgi:hypothetical protein